MGEAIGKSLVVAGALLAAAGALVWLLAKSGLLGQLPLDWRLERGRFTIWIPLGTSILLSVLLTLLLNLLLRLRR